LTIEIEQVLLSKLSPLFGGRAADVYILRTRAYGALDRTNSNQGHTIVDDFGFRIVRNLIFFKKIVAKTISFIQV